MNRLNGVVRELGRNALLDIYVGQLYISDRDALYAKDINFLYDISKYDTYFIDDQGLWLNYGHLSRPDEKTVCEFYDIFGKNGGNIVKSHNVDKYGQKIGSDYLLITGRRSERGLYLYDDIGNFKCSVKGRFALEFEVDSQHVYAKEIYGDVVCFDHELTEAWRVKSNKNLYSDAIAGPQLFKNLVIVNIGEKSEPPRGEFELNAYHTDNGNLVWQQVLETSPASSTLVKDKVYVIVDKRLLVIDAATGSIEVEEQHGFTPFNADTNIYKGAVYPMGDNLLCLSPPDRMIQIRSSDAKDILQTIRIPGSYTVKTDQPIRYEGKYYLPLTHIDFMYNGMSGAYIVLTEDANAPEDHTAEIEARPDFYISTINEHETGNDIYLVTVSHNNMDELIRFSTIALKELACDRGAYQNPPNRNKNHKGVVELVIDPAPLEHMKKSTEELMQELHVIKERVERWLQDMQVYAGDGTSPFVINIDIQ